MNRYDRYPGDYLRDTLTLNLAQDGAYTRLLDYYYSTEQPIPADEAFAAARCRGPEDEAVTQWVLSRFFKLTDLGYVHERAEREIEKARPRIEAARANGRKGGRKKDTKNKPSGLPSGIPSTEPTTNPTPKLPSPSPSPSPSLCAKQDQRQEQNQKSRRTAVAVAAPKKPESVSDQVWLDWLALRKQKKAPVTETVINGAISEAAKAGMTLQAFFAEWCTRGSQGLKADWITKPQSNGQKPPMAQAFANKTYVGTPDDELPDWCK